MNLQGTKSLQEIKLLIARFRSSTCIGHIYLDAFHQQKLPTISIILILGFLAINMHAWHNLNLRINFCFYSDWSYMHVTSGSPVPSATWTASNEQHAWWAQSWIRRRTKFNKLHKFQPTWNGPLYIYIFYNFPTRLFLS